MRLNCSPRVMQLAEGGNRAPDKNKFDDDETRNHNPI